MLRNVLLITVEFYLAGCWDKEGMCVQVRKGDLRLIRTLVSFQAEQLCRGS